MKPERMIAILAETCKETSYKDIDEIKEDLKAGSQQIWSDHALNAMQRVNDEWQEKYDALTGERFSDRNHTALHARIKRLEEETATLRAEVEEKDKLIDSLEKEKGIIAKLTLQNERMQDTINRSENWRREKKREAGYDNCESFDIIWKETFEKAKQVESLRAEVERLKGCEAIVRELASSEYTNDEPSLCAGINARQWVKDNTTKN